MLLLETLHGCHWRAQKAPEISSCSSEEMGFSGPETRMRWNNKDQDVPWSCWHQAGGWDPEGCLSWGDSKEIPREGRGLVAALSRDLWEW